VGDRNTYQGEQAGLRGTRYLPLDALVRRSAESHTDPLRPGISRDKRGDPMDAIILAVIIFVAIAGPTLLALALYWRNNPDRRLSWRRAAEEAADTDPEHFRRPSAQWLSFGGGGGSSDSGGGGGSSDSGGGGGSGGDSGGGSGSSQ
jgi:hypothetical protein